jgi:hypothetical protein
LGFIKVHGLRFKWFRVQGLRFRDLGFGIEGLNLEGVNHCSLHCRLAKFRGLMIMVKYGAVIGLNKPIAWKL